MLKKKWLLPLILVLVLTLTACTTDDENVDPDLDSDTAPVEDEATEDDEVDEDTGVTEEDAVDEDTEATEDLAVDDTDTAHEYSQIRINPVEAYDRYIEKYPGTTVKELKLNKDDNKYVYEFEGFDSEKKYELDIDPINGEILKEDADENLLNQDQPRIIVDEDIDKIESIIDSAISDAGENAVLEEWKLEADDGNMILEIEFENDIEYKYNVDTGELVEKDD